MAYTPKQPTPEGARGKAKAKAESKMKANKAAPKFSGKLNQASPGKSKTASSIAKRVGTVAREARDVVTAVGSIGTAAADAAKTRKATALKATVKDLPKQVKQVAKAAATGKSSNAALKVNTGKNSRWTNKATATRPDRKKK